MAIVILGNLVLGVIGLFGSKEIVSKSINNFYGASLELTPEIGYLIKMLGVFMLGIGILGIFAWINPRRNRGIIIGISILLLIRAFQRVAFSSEIGDIFNVNLRVLWIGTLFYLLLGLLLFFLRPKE